VGRETIQWSKEKDQAKHSSIKHNKNTIDRSILKQNRDEHKCSEGTI